MSAKIKVFKLAPEVSDEISEFMGSVKILNDGIIVSEGNIGIMYREKGEFGMERQDIAASISAELAKAQKQYALQDGLILAYTAMIPSLDAKVEETKKAVDELNVQGKAAKENVDRLEKEYKQAKRAKNDEAMKTLAAEHTEAVKLHSELSTKSANLGGKYKTAVIKRDENKDFLEKAYEDRDHAEIFISTTRKQIEQIEAGEYDDLIVEAKEE